MRLLLLATLATRLLAQDDVLRQFLPRFEVSPQDCAVLPAEFRADAGKPEVLAQNGTIYVSSTPKQSPLLEGEWLEVHYYHLWSKDCGPSGHALDAEHVSGLLRKTATGWEAAYWYAAAHEDTPCDAGRAGRASALDAVHRGPRVWISAGKHASFLSEKSCREGCKADQCQDSRTLMVEKLLSLDPEAAWVRSRLWPLREKFASDFSDEYLAALHKAPEHSLVQAKPYLLPARHTLGGAQIGIVHTDNSLQKAGKETKRGLGEAYRRVRRYLGW